MCNVSFDAKSYQHQSWKLDLWRTENCDVSYDQRQAKLSARGLKQFVADRKPASQLMNI